MLRRTGWIDWNKSEAKGILLDDLHDFTLTVDEDVVPAEMAWEFYRHLPEFAEVVFEQFKARLQSHRQQVKSRIERAEWESAAMEHDRSMNPYPTHDHRGRPNFYLSPAAPLLRQDLLAGKH